jgi:hypothetical protein
MRFDETWPPNRYSSERCEGRSVRPVLNPKATPVSYTITVLYGGKAFEDNPFSNKEITSALIGDMVLIEPDVVSGSGKYVKKWLASPNNVTWIQNDGSIARFTMPAANVTLIPEYADQEETAIDLSSGDYVEVGFDVFWAINPQKSAAIFPLIWTATERTISS